MTLVLLINSPRQYNLLKSSLSDRSENWALATQRTERAANKATTTVIFIVNVSVNEEQNETQDLAFLTLLRSTASENKIKIKLGTNDCTNDDRFFFLKKTQNMREPVNAILHCTPAQLLNEEVSVQSSRGF
jgi:hypothetical protein